MLAGQRSSGRHHRPFRRLDVDPLYRARVRYCAGAGLALSAFLAWSPADQAAALAWQEWSALTCPGCGIHPSVWDGDGITRLAVTTTYCPGCAARDGTETPDAPGVRSQLTLTGGDTDAG